MVVVSGNVDCGDTSTLSSIPASPQMASSMRACYHYISFQDDLSYLLAIQLLLCMLLFFIPINGDNLLKLKTVVGWWVSLSSRESLRLRAG